MPAPSRRGSVAFSLLRSLSGGDGGLALGELVDPDKAQVVLGDLARAGRPLDLSIDVGFQRVPPDRASDREPDEAVDGSRCRQPLVDLGVVCATAEDHADDARAPAGARLGDEHLAVGALVDALDLPNVDLDAEVLDLGDRATHQLGTKLCVIALGVPADGL